MSEVIGPIVIAAQAIFFVVFIGWREWSHQKLVDALTSKIMSKNYVEFSTYRPEELKAGEVKEKDDKRVVPITDPVLGRVF